MRKKTMKAKVLIAIVCIGAFAAGVYAQQGGSAGQNPTTTKGAILKGKAPVNKNLLTVKLPKPREATLKNGLHVVLLESNHTLRDARKIEGIAAGMGASHDHTFELARMELCQRVELFGHFHHLEVFTLG